MYTLVLCTRVGITSLVPRPFTVFQCWRAETLKKLAVPADTSLVPGSYHLLQRCSQTQKESNIARFAI